MSDLTRYNGNFVQSLDAEMDQLKAVSRTTEHSYSYSSPIDELDISVYCKVAILPSSNQCATVDIDTDNIEDFKVSCDRGRLSITQKGNNSATFIKTSSGGTVISNVSGNMSIINGQVYVNGVPVDQGKSGKQSRPSQVVVYCPQNIDLVADLSGDATLASKVLFSKASVDVSGCGAVGLAAKSLRMKLSGQGNSFIVMRGGALDLRLSGQGDLRVKGEWAEADVSISGMGSVLTEGKCLGNYSAKVSGMGSIERNGEMPHMSTDRWLEIRQISGEYGLCREDAIALIDKAPGEWKNKVYHSCCDCPVGVIHGDTVEFVPSEICDDDTWTCPACEEEIFSMDELTLEPFKVLPECCDRATILNELLEITPLPPREKTEQEEALELLQQAYAGDREAFVKLMKLLQKKVEVGL